MRPMDDDTLERIVMDAAAVLVVLLVMFGMLQWSALDALRGGLYGVLVAGAVRLVTLWRAW